jgi:asparagine synthase (glutamine-hydrolysing)
LIFCAHLGDQHHLPSWRAALDQHAAWLGLRSHLESRPLPDGQSFAFGWLGPAVPAAGGASHETADSLVMVTAGDGLDDQELPAPGSLDRVDRNVILVSISPQSGEIEIWVPPATPEQFYYTRDGRGTVLGNDMRLLMRWAGMELDPRAVFALFRYLAIPPPLTLSKNVHRIPNGHTFKLAPDSSAPAIRVQFQPGQDRAQGEYVDDPERRIRETLDSYVAGLPAATALLFSGGVDSGLVAARLAAIGRRDVTLVNYSFGAGDREAELAMRMAAHLGLACQQVLYQPEHIGLVLERLGQDYSYPFGDVSLVPTNLLVHAALRVQGPLSAVVDGTGADGAFGMVGLHARWQRFYSVPYPVRWLAGKSYGWLRLWQHRSRLEGWGRLVRRSLQLPLPQAAVVGITPLDGIAYDIPSDIRAHLEGIVHENVLMLGRGLGHDEQMSLLDLVQVCAGRFASKTFDPLRIRGVRPLYPYMEPPMLRLSSAIPPEQKAQDGEPKALLKRLLAHSVPREMVYRHKSHFIPPKRQMFAAVSMQEFLGEVVMSPRNPLLGFCRPAVVRKMIERSRQGQPLSSAAYNFLWVLAFASGWLRQLELLMPSGTWLMPLRETGCDSRSESA